MEFIAILIAWAAVQLWGSGGAVQRDGWLQGYNGLLSALPSPALRLTLLVLPPALLVALAVDVLRGWVFGLPALLLSLVVLLYALGRGDFQIQLRLYLNSWQRGDLAGAYRHGQHFSEELCDSGADNALELHHSVRQAVFYQGFERWFAVVFWFVVLGAGGALAYRLLFLAARHRATGSKQEDRNLAVRALFYVEWLPVRLLGFVFTLIGHFDEAFAAWRRHSFAGLAGGDADVPDSAEYLDAVGSKALSAQLPEGQVEGECFTRLAAEQLSAVQQLLSRSLLCWVAALAVMEIL